MTPAEKQSYVKAFVTDHAAARVRGEGMTRPRSNEVRNERIITLYASGFTASYIAEALGLPLSTVGPVASRARIRTRKWGRNPRRQDVGGRYTPEMHRAVVAGRYSGMTYRDLSEKHGISAKSCWRLVNEKPMPRPVSVHVEALPE